MKKNYGGNNNSNSNYHKEGGSIYGAGNGKKNYNNKTKSEVYVKKM